MFVSSFSSRSPARPPFAVRAAPFAPFAAGAPSALPSFPLSPFSAPSPSSASAPSSARFASSASFASFAAFASAAARSASSSALRAAAARAAMQPKVASRSRTSRNSLSPRSTAFDHSQRLRRVAGFSHSAPIIISRPASMRLAMAISPSRDSSSTAPISRIYMRTGSSVRPSSASLALAAAGWAASAGRRSCASSPSSDSTRLMPSSEIVAMVSSICSDDTRSDGSAALRSS